ncbi:hypothetical protein FB459_2022 [Yimella lutea]|uniref:Uncharacterized protein n=1 Tax=Yimella lutea TaxID=587872 RepID=A0A542EGW7_9MICO|nr:hypothetical protein [Yimella lutea]TQJ14555.1 hypothetical protein FB459_2022 [Yimella lutea]
MSCLSDYYAAKDAEQSDGSVDWSQVPARNGGRKITDHPQDCAWWKDEDDPQVAHRNAKFGGGD